MKATLKIKDKEKNTLLDLFPKNILDNVEVITPFNSDSYLHLLFYQQNTNDEKRVLSKYKKWLYDEKSKYSKWQKDSLDIIYYDNMSEIKKGTISKKDKLLLSLKINKDCDKNKIAYINGIQRNSDENLKGVGEIFYDNLKNFLKQKNFNYITCVPYNDEKVISWWKDKGFNLFEEKNYPEIKIYDRFTIFKNLYISKL